MLTPSALPVITGNAMTVERWRRGLTARGGEVLVLESRDPDLPALAAAVAAFRRGEPLTLDLDGETIELSESDVLVETTEKQGLVAQENRGITVGLLTGLTPELL